MKNFSGITRLVAEGFRGATSRIEIDLSPERPFVLLFGENGSGKSTLVDAIEFALWGTKGSLGDFKSTTLKLLGTQGTEASPLQVQLEVGGALWAGYLAKPSASNRRASIAGIGYTIPPWPTSTTFYVDT